jgi:hypothetical protein
MPNNSLTKDQMKTYLTSLSQNYVNSGWLNIAEGTMLNQLFDTLFERKLNEFRVHIAEYENVPEQLIPVLTAFTRVVAVLINDQGNSFNATGGTLDFRCISRPGVWKQFSKFRGEETHELTVFLSGKAPEGYKRYKDDRLLSARDAKSGPVSANEAWAELARVCEESITLRNERQDPFPWRCFEIEPHMRESHRATMKFITDKRIFAKEVAQEQASRNAVSYQYWRFQNRDKLKRFGL